MADKDVPVLTTHRVFRDDQNALRIEFRRLMLLEDLTFRKKIFHFDYEWIPARVVVRSVLRSHGQFAIYGSPAKLAGADLLRSAGEKTPRLAVDSHPGLPESIELRWHAACSGIPACITT